MQLSICAVQHKMGMQCEPGAIDRASFVQPCIWYAIEQVHPLHIQLTDGTDVLRLPEPATQFFCQVLAARSMA